MSTITVPVNAGLLRAQDGLSIPVNTFSNGATFTAFNPVIATACGTGDTLTVILSKQSGGGAADDITATWVDLELLPGSVAGGPIILDPGGTLYIVIDSDLADQAMDLSGYIDAVIGGGTIVTGAFTTLGRVNQRIKVPIGEDADRDTEVESLILEVSAAMQDRLWQRIEELIGKVELYDNGASALHLALEDPITSPASLDVRIGAFGVDDIIPPAEVRLEGRVLHRLTSTGLRSSWGSGLYQLTYDAGFTATPPGLVIAATDEVINRLQKSAFGDGLRVGVESRTRDAGTSETYTPDGMLPSTIEAINAHNTRPVRNG
jgi:hypothetical protein